MGNAEGNTAGLDEQRARPAPDALGRGVAPAAAKRFARVGIAASLLIVLALFFMAVKP